MTKRRFASGSPQKPADAQAGAAFVRKFMVKLFDKDDGEAANWSLITQTLFIAVFETLEKIPDKESRSSLLRRVHSGSYERLTAVADEIAPESKAGQESAVCESARVSTPIGTVNH